jgi:thiol:disulfide interchange protein DsbC
MAADVPQAVTERLQQLIPEVEADAVTPAELPGLYVVTFGPRVLYISADGRYVVRGDVIDLAEGTNLTESRRQQARIDAVESFSDSAIAFVPKETRYTVNIFTDINCGYCAKLHSEITALNALGIRVRYLAFPRAGLRSGTYRDMVSVWCADDVQQAMTDAKAGRRVNKVACENPVADHFHLGNMLGVRGTPTIVLENGEILPGYLPPDELAKRLEQAAGS